MDDLLLLVKGKSASDPQLRAVRKKVKKGTADFNDTAQYSEALSKLIGKNLSANILDIPPDVREELSTELLEYGYTDINELLNDVQISLDEKNGINIRPQRADFPTERVEQFVHSLIDPTVDDSTIKRRAKAGSETITKSFHDDYMKKNAAFRSDAGLKCYIVRTAAYKCCEWCSNIAGRYPYNVDEMPEDVFRRHDNCDCRTILENGRERQDVWSKRTWEVPETGPGAESPAVFTEEQARAKESENLVQFQGLPQNQNYTITPKSQQNAYSVNRDLVNSKAYHDKFENLTPHRAANENIYQQSKRLLEHRDGSESESLIVLDSRTGKLIVDNFKNPDQSLKTKLTDKQYELVKNHKGNFIMLHNHPAGVRPSGTDILTLWGQTKADRTIIVGHDGSVFEISNINRDIPLDKIYKNAYNNAIENNIPKDYAKIIATNALYDTRAFDYAVR